MFYQEKNYFGLFSWNISYIWNESVLLLKLQVELPLGSNDFKRSNRKLNVSMKNIWQLFKFNNKDTRKMFIDVVLVALLPNFNRFLFQQEFHELTHFSPVLNVL